MTTHGRRRGWLSGVAVAAILLAGACSGDDGGSAGGPDGSAGGTAQPARYPRDGELRLNHLQALGSHNSYHLEPAEDLQRALNQRFPGTDLTSSWQYSHKPLPEQFDQQGIRQIELDVWADPDGTRWCTHHVLPLLGQPLDSCTTPEPGFKVQHVQELDYRVTCPSLVRCLREVKTWSDAHPGHMPLAVLIEAKDGPAIPDPLGLGFVQPLPIGTAELDAVDAEIRSVFGDDDMITPDDVRGDKATLDEAVRSGTGWPTLGESRGKVLFLLDNTNKRAAYVEGRPALQGRVMFTDAPPGAPDAAFMKRNDPLKSATEIDELVKQGYVVRTRSDGDTKEARSGDTSVRDAALRSGAQWISTDYPVADTRFGQDFVVTLEGGTPARCNPVVAPPSCTPSDIEDPKYLRQ